MIWWLLTSSSALHFQPFRVLTLAIFGKFSLLLCILVAQIVRVTPKMTNIILDAASQLGIQNAGSNVPMLNGNCEKKPLKEKVIILGKGNTVIKITTAIKP